MGDMKCSKMENCTLRLDRHPAIRDLMCNDDCMNFDPQSSDVGDPKTEEKKDE